MRRSAVNLVMATTLVALASSESMACSCVPQAGSLEDQVLAAYDANEVVAIARSASAQMVIPEWARGPEYSSVAEQRVTWQLLEVFKGASVGTLTTQQMATSYSSCAFSFVVNRDYLLYLLPPRTGGHYKPNRCSRTRMLEGVDEEEIEILRRLRENEESR